MVKYLSLYLVFTCFNPNMVSYSPLVLHACTDMKYFFLDSVCRKGLPFTKKESIASSAFWWCWSIRGGKGILGMFFWCPGIPLISLPCIMGIWGPYMASSLVMSLVVIGQFLIWFFWMDSFKVCVDVHPKSCCNILALSASFISRL